MVNIGDLRHKAQFYNASDELVATKWISMKTLSATRQLNLKALATLVSGEGSCRYTTALDECTYFIVSGKKYQLVTTPNDEDNRHQFMKFTYNEVI